MAKEVMTIYEISAAHAQDAFDTAREMARMTGKMMRLTNYGSGLEIRPIKPGDKLISAGSGIFIPEGHVETLRTGGCSRGVAWGSESNRKPSGVRKGPGRYSGRR